MTALQVSAQRQLKQFVEQIERLEEEKKALGGDVKDKYAEAKALGFDTKIIKKVVAIRRKKKSDYLEEEAVLDAYLHATTWLDTPLGGSQPSPSQEAEYV